MSYNQVTTEQQLAALCDELSQAEVIAFDTEFVSEHTYRSQLCLVQICTPAGLSVIDPLSAGDLTRFWEVLARPNHQTIVHAGREELGFALQAVNQCPANLFDVQIAAGFISDEFPSGYGTLLSRLLGVNTQKGETRTDWRRRPLSAQQLEYALDDVRYLIPLRDKLLARLDKTNRTDWFAAEMQDFQQEVIASRSRERWRRVSGISGLSPRSLAVARELWRWREGEAQRRDTPAKFVLRDDLLVELARRRTAEMRQIRAVRGLERSELQRLLPKIAEHIQLALDLPQQDLPQSERREVPQQINVLGQFLSTALTSLCRSLGLAPALVGTASDVRDLIAFRLGFVNDESAALACGWRAEVVGTLIDDLLAGKLSIRITDPLSDHPLVFEKTNQAAPAVQHKSS
ncbi:MAG TPA: ribonuclease D [Pirellulales bacterium]|jgi:ribonuclease D|nr:ribonuclease D [Pirellulales bacterium]